jgi:hypothetical protein
MADTLVERLRDRANWLDSLDLLLPEDVELLREAADHIGLLTRSLEMMCKQTSNTSAQGDGSGE